MALRNAFADLLTVSKPYRREFVDATLAEWDVTTGSGMTVTSGTGQLVVTSGTTLGAETVLTTKASFAVPFKAQFGFKLSQKIAGTAFYMELVGEDPATEQPDPQTYASWRIYGADTLTVTSCATEVRDGAPPALSGIVSGQVSQLTDAVYAITLENDEVWFTSRGADSTALNGTPFVRNSVSPSPLRRYRLRYRVRNVLAPVSSTTMTASFVTAVDYSDQQAELTNQGNMSSAAALPVYSVGGSALNAGLVSPSASVSVVGTLMAKVMSLATTNPVLVKATTARLYGVQLANVTASWRFVKFYNKATAPVVGTDVPVYTLALPPNTLTDVDNTTPTGFLLGMGYGITAAQLDNDVTPVAAGDVQGVLLYV